MTKEQKLQELVLNGFTCNVSDLIDCVNAELPCYNWKRLRTCSAYVIDTDSYYVLRSYNTIIACIDKATDTCYDFLRYVYGYTSTSAQHIAKFRHDYGSGKWGCTHEIRFESDGGVRL